MNLLIGKRGQKSILMFFDMLDRSQEVECAACDFRQHTVYRSPDGREPLRNCSSVASELGHARLGDSNLYAIIGGVVGAAAFAALFFCCIRFVLAEVHMRRNGSSSLSLSRRRQRNQTRSTANNLAVGGASGGLCTNQ